MIRKVFSLIALAVLLCLTCQLVSAQNSPASDTTIHGYVVDAQKNPLAGATVDLYGKDASPAKPTMTSLTDANGYYVFKNLPAGDYSLQASRDFYVYTTTDSVGTGDYSLDLTLPANRTMLA